MIGVLALAAPLVAAAPKPFTLPHTQVVGLHSKADGQDYVLYVSLPRDYRADQDRLYPVVYTLDADYAFPIVASVLGHFADRGNLPPAIVVGIAYPGGISSMDSYHRNRTRDYTPTHTLEGGYSREIAQLSGGGPAFEKFITSELFPYVEKHYRADPGERTLVGHSFGGLFGTYILLTHPRAFRNYVIVSPSLWYDHKVAFKLERAYAKRHRDLRARAYFLVGSYENQPEHGRPMVDDMEALVAALEGRHYPHLEIAERVFDKETHNSVFPVAVTRGLRVLLLEPEPSQSESRPEDSSKKEAIRASGGASEGTPSPAQVR